MISAVNGYVCFSSCDAEKAKQGKDPHTFPDPTDAKERSRAHQPSMILDGALKGSQTPADDGIVRQPLLNILT